MLDAGGVELARAETLRLTGSCLMLDVSRARLNANRDTKTYKFVSTLVATRALNLPGCDHVLRKGYNKLDVRCLIAH